MRRSTALRLLILALIAGVLTNFGICWYALYSSGGRPAVIESRGGYYFRSPNGLRQWDLRGAWRHRTYQWVWVYPNVLGTRPAPSWCNLYGLKWVAPFESTYMECKLGWPRRSMWCYQSGLPLTYRSSLERLAGPKHLRKGPNGTLVGGVAFQDSLRIPLRFIPSGFALNTIFWSSLWFALLFAARFIRRRRRITRGLCPACAYKRTGLGPAPCPECGLAPKRAFIPAPPHASSAHPKSPPPAAPIP